MKLPSLIIISLLLVITLQAKPKIEKPTNSLNRPIFHFTPQYGWMNDPNGLWHEIGEGENGEDIWHLYYQYNPNGTVWALPLYWGHATSKDLITWEHDEDVAVSPFNDKSGAYSGSAVVDEDNTSGFFGALNEAQLPKSKRVVAIWTFNADDWIETQCISFSLDGGSKFKHYRMNPVIAMNSKQFRDPQVIRYENEHWVMSVAKSHQYKIQFYTSTNLKNWKVAGAFSLYGYLGYQYECPNLAKMKYNGETEPWNGEAGKNNRFLWVLFISINPGSLQGGSSTEYFIGNFDGNNFTPIRNYAAPIDYGKDFYALQIFFNSKDDSGDIYGIAWTSNWQYSGNVPTDNWRSSMSLVRRMTLADFESAPGTKIAFIKSEPVTSYNGGNLRYGKLYSVKTGDENFKLNPFYPTHTIDISQQENSGAVEFKLTFNVTDGQWTKPNPAHFYLDFKGYMLPDEYLRLGYEGEAGAFFVDRGHTNVDWVHDNPFFTDKLSVHIQPQGTSGDIKTYFVHGFIDRNIVELYFNDGYQVFTNTFFMTGGNWFGTVDLTLNKIDYDFKSNKYYEPFTFDFKVRQVIGTDGETDFDTE